MFSSIQPFSQAIDFFMSRQISLPANFAPQFRFYLVSVCLFVCLSVCLSVCLFVCLSVCLFVCLSVFLFLCVSLSLIFSNRSRPKWRKLAEIRLWAFWTYYGEEGKKNGSKFPVFLVRAVPLFLLPLERRDAGAHACHSDSIHFRPPK